MAGSRCHEVQDERGFVAYNSASETRMFIFHLTLFLISLKPAGDFFGVTLNHKLLDDGASQRVSAP